MHIFFTVSRMGFPQYVLQYWLLVLSLRKTTNIMKCVSFPVRAAMLLMFATSILSAQDKVKIKYDNTSVFAGIEVGSKGVKMSVVDVDKNGKSGTAFTILKDTSFAQNLNDAIVKIKVVGEEVDSLANEIGKVVTGIREDINNGKGAVSALFKDSAMVIKLNASLDNIQKGTDGFNQNMEALKHNILLRGYFRKQEKQKRN